MNRRKLRVIGALTVFLGLVAVTDGTSADRRPIWERVDQYIAIENQDSATEPNNHPLRLLPDQVRATLAPLRVVMERGKPPVPLFSDGELENLSEGLASALSSASLTEDATFAIIGLHGAVLGLFKQPVVTTGRVFYHQGKLNLIFGQVHEPVNERDDRRLKPFIPGSRTKDTDHRWRLTTSTPEGVTYREGRTDWILVEPVLAPQSPLPPKSEAPQEPVAAKRSVEERLRLLNALQEKNLVTEEEYQSKRKEILSDI